jgi:hypothetical protein
MESRLLAAFLIVAILSICAFALMRMRRAVRQRRARDRSFDVREGFAKFVSARSAGPPGGVAADG